jgi:hypothetical protein
MLPSNDTNMASKDLFRIFLMKSNTGYVNFGYEFSTPINFKCTCVSSSIALIKSVPLIYI